MNRVAAWLGASIVISAGPALAANHIVEIAWGPDGRFAHRVTIEPDKFVEVCGKFEQSDVVHWNFSASAPLDFNIHYHVSNGAEFPARLSQVSSGRDTLRVLVREDYCWTWRNKTTGRATVDVQLQR